MSKDVQQELEEPKEHENADASSSDLLLLHTTPDPVLARLVDIANRLGSGFELGITLHVSGLVVSGTLISGRIYFELLQEMIATKGQSNQPDMLDVMVELFAHDVEFYRDGETRSNGDRSQKSVHTTYVHLKSAHVHSQAGNGNLPGNLWRGRLSHVSGWSLGYLSVSS